MKPELAFKKGTAVITGAGGGIGEGMAKLAASYGMNVVVAEISKENGERVASEINASGGTASFVHTDVSDSRSVNNLADIAYDTYGDVTLLVNNAGIGVIGTVWEISDSNWDNAIGVNIKGPINGIKAFAPRMLESDQECYISNVASIAAVSVAEMSAPYISSKHQLLALTETLYLEMQQQDNPVNVSVILPGIVSTNIMKNQVLSDPKYGEMQKMFGAVLSDQGMPVEEAAKIFMTGIAEKDFWITSHPGVLEKSASSRAKALSERGVPFALGKEIFD